MNNAESVTQLAKPIVTVHKLAATPDKSLFERFDWLYILCREKLFRDDTQRIITALWRNAEPTAGTRLIEFGCGPGFYSRRLAQRFPHLEVRGVDQSHRQLDFARQKVAELRLNNCSFECGNVLDLTRPDESFDYVIASRLFTVLSDPERAVAEMFRVLRPGGRCFIAEPRHKTWASIPLFTMRLIASFTPAGNGSREPAEAKVFSATDFSRLFRTQPWQEVRVWQEGRYQYAVCRKS